MTGSTTRRWTEPQCRWDRKLTGTAGRRRVSRDVLCNRVGGPFAGGRVLGVLPRHGAVVEHRSRRRGRDRAMGGLERLRSWPSVCGGSASSLSGPPGRTPADSHDQDASLLAAVSFSAVATASLLPWMRNRSLVERTVQPCGVSVGAGAGLQPRQQTSRGRLHRQAQWHPAFIDGWVDGLREAGGGPDRLPDRGVANAIADFDRLLSTGVSHDPLAGQNPPAEFLATRSPLGATR